MTILIPTRTNELIEAQRSLADAAEKRRQVAGRHPNAAAGSSSTLWAKITGSSLISGHANRWTYTVTEQALEKEGRWKDKADGYSGAAYNTIEANNTSSGVQGDGTDVDNLPAGVELQPIGNGAVVRAWRVINCEGAIEVMFAAPNNPGGGCP